MAVDLAEPGTMFLAQRRVSSTNPNLDVDLRALDYPTSFDATNWVIRNGDTMFDGFTAMDGTYGVTPIVDVMANDPFFVSPTDSHLDVGADGIDTGVAPSSIDPTLDLGTTLDGVDRNGRVIDHGAYEQGM
jgi:hypothetical protein